MRRDANRNNKRITEELRKQGIDYTPLPPERTEKN